MLKERYWARLRSFGASLVALAALLVGSAIFGPGVAPASASTIDNNGGGCQASLGSSVPSAGYLYLKITFTCSTPLNIGSGFTVQRSGKVVSTGPYKECPVTTRCVWTSHKLTDPAGSQKWEVLAEWTTSSGMVGDGSPEVHRNSIFTMYH